MKNYIITVVVAALVGAGAFYGGLQVGKGSGASVTPQALQNLSPDQRQQLFQSFRGQRSSGSGQNGGGFASGDVINKDSQSITVKTRNGSSLVILYTASTNFVKPSPAMIDDVSVGSSIAVMGTQNSDGSFTASSVQLRPASQGAGQ